MTQWATTPSITAHCVYTWLPALARCSEALWSPDTSTNPCTFPTFSPPDKESADTSRWEPATEELLTPAIDTRQQTLDPVYVGCGRFPVFPFPRDTAGSVGTQAQGTTGAKCVVTTTTTTCVNTFLPGYSDGGPDTDQCSIKLCF